ncbi:MAG: SAM-dependent methyltransferase [Idiomarinaceae bacterium]|uniref:SAM-dependent methyltransferase n=1 Tax=Pseudidiomarina aquimaris TaxID=641841 RepID=A0A432XJI9_9GAMM|nr:methyltransferase domain-containing protein [Pseudidiomarina aquimaris]MBG22595.1 SAM-dependent methyltransferase [Idiomarinaceae bacterium]RUO48757.1 SAM-dependent methyltransferase [Pseudidiomarina aquimaris]|tara:strand:- start:222 stop:968 length:747 start_codon:yes stop_codon:yes gene_type:complete
MLKPALRDKRTAAPANWQDVAHGTWLQSQVEQVLAPHIERLYGYHFAAVGPLSAHLSLPKSAIKHCFTLAEGHGKHVNVCAESTQLPFAEASLDAILLACELEFAQDPHQVLREVSHSLIADGKLIYVGFNPFAWHQVQQLWPRQVNQLPWRGRSFTRARVLDWLALLNFEVCETHYFAPSFLQQRWQWPERLATKAHQWLPQLASCYFIVARKREYPLTLLPERSKRKRVQPNLQTVPLANQTQLKE